MADNNIFEDYKAAAAFVEKITATEDALNILYRNGKSETHLFNSLKKVTIITTDQGPFADDVFWLLLLDSIIMIAQGTTGEDALLSRLQSLPGFNNEQVIEAMSCSDNNSFLVWERPV